MASFKDKLSAQRAKDALDKSLASAKKAGAPSLNPQWRKDKEKEPPPPDIEEFGISDDDKNRLTRYVLRKAAIIKEVGRLKRDGNNVSDVIKSICKIYALDKFMVAGSRVAYTKTSRSTLSKELLLAHNVSPATIAACTVTTEAETLRVYAPGSKDENEEEV